MSDRHGSSTPIQASPEDAEELAEVHPRPEHLQVLFSVQPEKINED